MKPWFRLSSFSLTLLVVLCVGSSVSSAQQEQSSLQVGPPHCSNSSLSGAYGFLINGTNIIAGPYSLSGRFVADGKGNFSGTDVQAVNGYISRPSFTGTYTVKPDCTGTATLTFDYGGTAPLDFTIVDDGKQVYIMVSGDNGTYGNNEVGTATRQFARPSPL